MDVFFSNPNFVTPTRKWKKKIKKNIYIYIYKKEACMRKACHPTKEN
jgi:hypothetical protein